MPTLPPDACRFFESWHSRLDCHSCRPAWHRADLLGLAALCLSLFSLGHRQAFLSRSCAWHRERAQARRGTPRLQPCELSGLALLTVRPAASDPLRHLRCLDTDLGPAPSPPL